jgi:hypothetical protein
VNANWKTPQREFGSFHSAPGFPHPERFVKRAKSCQKELLESWLPQADQRVRIQVTPPHSQVISCRPSICELFLGSLSKINDKLLRILQLF